MFGLLGDTQLFMEKRNAVFKIRHNRACLVYECLRNSPIKVLRMINKKRIFAKSFNCTEQIYGLICGKH